LGSVVTTSTTGTPRPVPTPPQLAQPELAPDLP